VKKITIYDEIIWLEQLHSLFPSHNRKLILFSNVVEDIIFSNVAANSSCSWRFVLSRSPSRDSWWRIGRKRRRRSIGRTSRPRGNWRSGHVSVRTERDWLHRWSCRWSSAGDRELTFLRDPLPVGVVLKTRRWGWGPEAERGRWEPDGEPELVDLDADLGVVVFAAVVHVADAHCDCWSEKL